MLSGLISLLEVICCTSMTTTILCSISDVAGCSRCSEAIFTSDTYVSVTERPLDLYTSMTVI